MQANSRRERPLIKCVVWDLDNTLWPGIAIESSPGELPQPDPSILDIINELERRGIVNSVASRNDPALGVRLLEHPMLAGKFVSPQVGWEPKSASVRRIAANLNIGLDAVCFVDDSPFERAEANFMLPQVLTLAPDDVPAAMQTPAFNPPQLTVEGASRAEMYRAEEQRRAAEQSYKGSRTDFLMSCDMRLAIALAVESDLDRIAELTERTHQLNSTGRQYSIKELRERVESRVWLVPVARLTDRFGDYGIIGVALVDRSEQAAHGAWLAELVMLSCRVEGRGIPATLLLWIMNEAQNASMRALRAVYRVNERNLPVRLLFRQMGFRSLDAGASLEDGELVVVERDLSGPLPDYPEWLRVG